MIVIVCGGRDARDPGPIFWWLGQLHAALRFTRLIEGGQRTVDAETGEPIGGVDYFANIWARANKIPCDTVRADWNRHGRAAGPIRNRKMLEMKPDAVVAFPGGAGTADMMRQAIAAGVRVYPCENGGPPRT